MALKIVCSVCSAAFPVQTDLRGKTVRCAQCRQVFAVPPAEAPAPEGASHVLEAALREELTTQAPSPRPGSVRFRRDRHRGARPRPFRKATKVLVALFGPGWALVGLGVVGLIIPAALLHVLSFVRGPLVMLFGLLWYLAMTALVVVGTIRVYVAHRARYIRARLILIAILTVYSMSNLFYGHVFMNVERPPASPSEQADRKATQAPGERTPTERSAPDPGTVSSSPARASARVYPPRPSRPMSPPSAKRSPTVRSIPDPEAAHKGAARREAHLAELRQGEPEEVRTIDLEDGTSTDDLLLVMEQGSMFRKVDALNMLNTRGVRTPRFYQAAAMMLRDPNAITSDLLKRAGPVAEDAVLEVLRKSHDSRTKVEAITVLRTIGTEKSLPELTEAMGSPDPYVSKNATSADESVRRRAARAAGGDSKADSSRQAGRAR
jgi:predicted Zn finger-like uncharacterized protein